MIDLPDVNVWLALGIPDHPHSERSRRYWKEEAAEKTAFCRVTALAFLRLTTQAKVMGGDPLTVPEAWRAYQAFRDLEEIVFLDEPPGCEAFFGEWAQAAEHSPRLWTDAYLAAFTEAAGARLVTFDRDFRRFPRLDLLLLEP